jgi:hypothetical protein
MANDKSLMGGMNGTGGRKVKGILEEWNDGRGKSGWMLVIQPNRGRNFFGAIWCDLAGFA